MMGRQDNQIQLVILDIDAMIPQDYLMRRIMDCVNFNFIYGKAAHYYFSFEGKSINPVILIKCS